MTGEHVPEVQSTIDSDRLRVSRNSNCLIEYFTQCVKTLRSYFTQSFFQGSHLEILRPFFVFSQILIVQAPSETSSLKYRTKHTHTKKRSKTCKRTYFYSVYVDETNRGHLCVKLIISTTASQFSVLTTIVVCVSLTYTPHITLKFTLRDVQCQYLIEELTKMHYSARRGFSLN